MARYKNGIHRHVKGYPRVSAGPLRHWFIHRIIAGAMLGRELDKSEEVHHKDSDPRNFHWTNLMVLGSKDHGWVSSRQAWYMRERDKREKREWDKFMTEQVDNFHREVAEAKEAGMEWECADGKVRMEWERQEQQQKTETDM